MFLGISKSAMRGNSTFFAIFVKLVLSAKFGELANTYNLAQLNQLTHLQLCNYAKLKQNL